jgi:hypothetical protein
MDKEKYALTIQIKEKANEVKTTLEKQKTIYKGASGNSSKLEQKISLLQCENKKMETFIQKLQDQIKRLMGIDKIYYSNNLEITGKVTNGSGVYRNVPDLEYIE